MKKLPKNLPKFVNPVKTSIYPARTIQEKKLIAKNPWGDKDKDKVPNYMDCKPMNKKKQNFGGLLGGLMAIAITAEVAGSLMGRNKRRY